MHEGRAALTTTIINALELYRSDGVRLPADGVVRLAAGRDHGAGLHRRSVRRARGDRRCCPQACSARPVVASARSSSRLHEHSTPVEPVRDGWLRADRRCSPASRRGAGRRRLRVGDGRLLFPTSSLDTGRTPRRHRTASAGVRGATIRHRRACPLHCRRVRRWSRADRGGGPRRSTAGIVRPQELHVEAAWDKADLRVGLGRVVWGRLDEFQPTDVVNPLDLARFFFEGRAEGRMPVALVRAPAAAVRSLRDRSDLRSVFRRGRFDQLDEDTSPFNVAPRTTCALVSNRPAAAVVARTPIAMRRAVCARASRRAGWTGPSAPIAASRRFRSIEADRATATGAAGGRRAISALHDGWRRLRDGARRMGAARRSRGFVNARCRRWSTGAASEVDRRSWHRIAIRAYRVSGQCTTRRWSPQQRLPRRRIDRRRHPRRHDRPLVRARNADVRVFAVYNPAEAERVCPSDRRLQPARQRGARSIRRVVHRRRRRPLQLARHSRLPLRPPEGVLLIVPLHAANPGPMTGAGNWTYFFPGAHPVLIDAGTGLAGASRRHRRNPPRGPGPCASSATRTAITSRASARIAARWPETAFSKYPVAGARREIPASTWEPLADGDMIPAGDTELQVVHTPGHAPDHIALLARRDDDAAFRRSRDCAGTTVVILAIARAAASREYLHSLEARAGTGARAAVARARRPDRRSCRRSSAATRASPPARSAGA